ncbi:DUF998 domain-containing protein [Nocardioides sp. GY 10113]|uniref:DUF998 domain-containing protein n=1 Tax=Nocardioides sp. GY 10113 TaxID=2569761 RepID=UPI0010A8F581|nr:DUF998 domain-containing protein [Nocardioides sp. GY 10113]TIC81298.1 DUF998 domain-containing protein [Nocardioides sp. GY 10113]
MPTTTRSAAPGRARHRLSATGHRLSATGDGPAGNLATRVLLACGIAYAGLYPVLNDPVAATLYDGYDRTSQAVSELSATGAPTHTLLTVTGLALSALQTAFGVGIWRAAGRRRSLRVAGAIVTGHGVLSVLWAFGPMSRREVIAAGGATSADTLHLWLAGATGVLVLAEVVAAAFAFGWVFRAYSALTVAWAGTFGMLSAQVDRIEAGDPTPWMGLLERAGIGAWLLWMAVLAVALLRRRP